MTLLKPIPKRAGILQMISWGKLCIDWEHEALEAAGSSRVVLFRTGIVLGKDGGALQKMYSTFKLGLGGIIGNGKQPFSWISLSDIADAVVFTIENEIFQALLMQ